MHWVITPTKITMKQTIFLLAALLVIVLLATCKKNDPESLGISAVGSSTCGVAFSSLASNTSGFEWDFGDGTAKSTEPNPVHTYACPGDYTVLLKASINGTISTESQTIRVTPNTFKVKYSASAATVIPTSDRGFAIFGSIDVAQSQAFYFIKTDCSGIRVWEKIYTGTAIDEAHTMVQTRDGGYILMGRTKLQGSYQPDLFIMKIDSAGNKEWENNFGRSLEEYVGGVQQTSDDGFVVFGSSRDSIVGTLDFYLVKTNKLGQVEWEKAYGGVDYDTGKSILVSEDGGYVMLGSTNGKGAGETDTYLVKVNSTGDVQWEKTYGGVYEDAGLDIATTADGGFVLAGYSQRLLFNFGYDMQLIKTNQFGDVVWMNSYDIQGYEYGTSVKPTADGGYILLGVTNGTGTMDLDYFLVKTDPNGTAQWMKTYGETSPDYAYSVAQTSDCDGYVMLGTISYKMCLIKTDKNGDSH